MSKFINKFYSSQPVIEDINEEPSLTDQSYKDECDLGFIIENYVDKGIPLPTSTLQFGDTTTLQEYQDAMYVVAEAKTNFEQLPSAERDRFGTVENFLEFVSNRDNLKECYEKGFIDTSSVSLDDVYPKQFNVVEEIEKIEKVDVNRVVAEPVTPPQGTVSE